MIKEQTWKVGKMMKMLFASISILLLLGAAGMVCGQDFTVDIKGEIPEPNAIIQLSRTPPEFESISIDRVAKDYGETAFALISDLVAPARDELEPMPMDDFKQMLRRERLPSR